MKTGTSSSWDKTFKSYRNGDHATVFELQKDPSLKRKDLIRDENKIRFPFVAGSNYKGGWENDLKNGFGTMESSDGTKYEGVWKLNKRHGSGTLWVKKGKKYMKRYVGSWSEGLMDGFGTYYYDNDEVYKGEWRLNQRQGNGRLDYANGDYYIGNWVNDSQHGQGILYYKNGNVFEGMWLNGKKEGPGKFFYSSTRKVYVGEWVNDQPRCGEYREPRNTDLSRFGKTNVRHETFALPELCLENSQAVLDIAISETRQLKAVERGISSTALTPEVLVAAEEIFISLDAEHAGYVSIWALTSVFAVLGVHISDEDMDLLIQELELDGACALSFPEVIDVASFLINKSSRNISGRGSFSEL